MIVRPAEPGDADVLARLRYEFRAALDQPVEPEHEFLERCSSWMREHLGSGGSWRCWVAEEAGAIVGTVWLCLIEKLPNPVSEGERHGYVSSLYVRPPHRGRGLGTALLSTCLNSCDECGVDAVILWPTAESRSLYQRHGFAAREDLLERH